MTSLFRIAPSSANGRVSASNVRAAIRGRRQTNIKPQRFGRAANGTAAVEFAIVANVFLLMLFGIISYGLYFGAAHSVEQLAADTARVSVAGLTDAERTTLAQSHIALHGADYPLLKPSRITLASGPAQSDPTQFQVHIRFDASDLPIWTLAPFVPMPARTIERTSTIKHGGY